MASLISEVDKPCSDLDLDDEEAEIGAGPPYQFSVVVPTIRDLSISQ